MTIIVDCFVFTKVTSMCIQPYLPLPRRARVNHDTNLLIPQDQKQTKKLSPPHEIHIQLNRTPHPLLQVPP